MLMPGNVPVVLDVNRQFSLAVDLTSLPGADATTFTTYTVVTKMRRSENLRGGNRVRVTFRGPNSTSCTLTAVYFGRAATTGNAYDFASSPTQLTFGGKTSVTFQANKSYSSDPITFDFDPSNPHIVAMNVSTATLRRLTAPTESTGLTSYYRAATSEASSTTKTAGYTAQADTAYAIVSILASGIPNVQE